jgi:hypothetical protein
MKTISFLSKVSSVLIVAGALFASAPSPSVSAGEVVIKRGTLDLKRPAASQFAAPKKGAVAMSCAACKPEFVPVTTQDSKLKTKTLLAERHACKSCTTTIKSVGAQKATRIDVSEHSCGGKLAAASSCCSSVPSLK